MDNFSSAVGGQPFACDTFSLSDASNLFVPKIKPGQIIEIKVVTFKQIKKNHFKWFFLLF